MMSSPSSNFKVFLQKYAYKTEPHNVIVNKAISKKNVVKPEKKKSTEESPPKKARTTLTYAPPEVYAHLSPLKDIIAEDLDILFIGINPGIKSASSGHHFAGPNNAFWPGLYKSGLLKEPWTPIEDENLPARYNYGITNLAQRPSRSSSELSKDEMKKAVPSLLEKIKKNHPKIICFIGKGIYEIFSGRKCTELGLQSEKIPCDYFDSQNNLRTRNIIVFAMPSTSARTSTYQFKHKLEYFIKLRELLESVKLKGLSETNKTGDSLDNTSRE